MVRIWALRFVLFFILVLITQPHFRFNQLMVFRLGNLTFGCAFIFHIINCMGSGRPLIRLGAATKLSLVLLAFVMVTHYFNPHQWNHRPNALYDSLWKVCVVAIILEAQMDNIYKSAAVLGTLAVGTLWWLKGGVRLAQAGATWGSGDRLMGANVSIIQNPNDFAYQLIFIIPVYFFFFNIIKNKYVKWPMLGLVFVAIFIALETGSRTGFLAFGMLTLVMLPRLVREYKGALILGTAAFAMMWVMIVSEGNRDRLGGVVDAMAIGLGLKEESSTNVVKADAESAGSRRIKAKAAMDTILKYPLLGLGTNPDPGKYTDPNAGGMVHCEILMAGRTMGLPGMAIYLLSIIIPIRLGNQVYRRAKVYWPEVSEIGYAVRNQMVVVILGGAFSPSLFHFPHMMCFVVVASSHKLLMDRIREDGLNPATIEAEFAAGVAESPEQGYDAQTPGWAPA